MYVGLENELNRYVRQAAFCISIFNIILNNICLAIFRYKTVNTKLYRKHCGVPPASRIYARWALPDFRAWKSDDLESRPKIIYKSGLQTIFCFIKSVNKTVA